MAIRFTVLLAVAFITAALFAVPATAADSGQLIAAVKDMPAQADKFRSMMGNLSVSQFHFVSVSSVVGGEESAYKASLRKNATALSSLRDTLSHATLTDDQGIVISLLKVMKAKELTIEQVTGIYVSGNSITLFYQ